jgi:hypothetical protein
MTHDRKRVSTDQAIKILSVAIYSTGLFLPSIVGLIVRAIVSAQGLPVVSIAEGAFWMVLFAACFFPPFAVLGWLAQLILNGFQKSSPHRVRPTFFLFGGAFVGMTIVLGSLLPNILKRIDFVAGVLALWIITIPAFLLYGAAGSVAGALLGWIIWRVGSYYKIS